MDATGRALTRRRRRLLMALVVHLAAMTFLAADGVDRVGSSGPYEPFDPSAYLLGVLAGVPVLLALLGTLLPGRAPRLAALCLGVLGVVVALLLVPLYGLGLLLLPGATLALWAGVPPD